MALNGWLCSRHSFLKEPVRKNLVVVREGGGTCKQMVINRTRPEFNGSATSFVEINTDPTSVKELRLACATHRLCVWTLCLDPLFEPFFLAWELSSTLLLREPSSCLGNSLRALRHHSHAFLLGTLLPCFCPAFLTSRPWQGDLTRAL